MDAVVRVVWLTGDWQTAAKQVESAFAPALATAAEAVPGAARVHFSVAAMNPLGRDQDQRGRPTFDLKSQTLFLSASLNYARWIEPNWDERVGDLVEVLSAAALGAPGTSLTPDVRDALVAAIERAGRETSATAPSQVAPLGPIRLAFTSEDTRPSVSYEAGGPSTFGPWRFEHVEPAQVPEMQARYFASTAPATLFKLYDDKRISYREAWVEGGAVVEHWGTCGTVGESRLHPIESEAEAGKVLARLRQAGEQAGFAAVAIADHATIVLEARTGPDIEGDLDLRYEFQSYLDEILGSTGLGHCDGGDIGGGAMGVLCLVVDKATALKLISERLPQSKFKRFSVVRRP